MPFLESQYSNQVTASAGDMLAPAQVTGLVYSVSQGKVTLAWNAVTTNSDGSTLDDLSSYRIFRKKNAGDAFAQIGQVDAINTEFDDMSAKDGADYIYAVAAFDDEPTPNEGEKSADLAVKTIPSIPTNLNSQGFDGKIRLDWTSVKDGEDAEVNENLAGYNVYRSDVDGSGYVKVGSAAPGEVSFEDSSVANGNIYYYVVTSYDNSL